MEQIPVAELAEIRASRGFAPSCLELFDMRARIRYESLELSVREFGVVHGIGPLAGPGVGMSKSPHTPFRKSKYGAGRQRAAVCTNRSEKLQFAVWHRSGRIFRFTEYRVGVWTDSTATFPGKTDL